jgi:hypothetical protein
MRTWLKLPKLPGKRLDDTPRVVLGGLGGALVGSGLAWLGISVVTSHSSPARLVPPVALLAVGALLFLWALRSSSDARRELLDEAIEAGRTFLRLPPEALTYEWWRWERFTIERLRENFGYQATYQFRKVGHSKDAERNLRAQIAILEELRKKLG